MDTKFIIIVGKTCTGKDTFVKELCRLNENIVELKNCTTRPKRNENEDTYNFITPREMFKMLINDELIECQEYNDWFYGTEKKAINEGKINVVSLAIERANLYYDYLKEKNLLNNTLVVFMFASEQERVNRYIKRLMKDNKMNLENLSELVRRFKTEEKDYKMNALEDFPNKIYFNTDKEKYKADKEKVISKVKEMIGE